MTLPEAVFSSNVSDSVVHSAVVHYLARQRQGTHATKTRSMVSGGGKKPWKQKHTGRARHGSNRSPLWRGGGITFGPQPREYATKIPRNVKRVALYKALTMKLSDNEIVVVDSLSFDKPRTKEMVEILKKLGLSDKTVLVVVPDKDENVRLSVRNIPMADVVRVSDLHAYPVAVCNTLLFTAGALQWFQGSKEVAAS
jgi:large subunit ribosomal protein L4